MNYQHILQSKIVELLNYLPFLLVGIYLTVLTLRMIFREDQERAKKKSVGLLILCAMLAVFAFYIYINEAGIFTVQMYMDMRNDDFQYYEGYIEEAHRRNSMRGTYVRLNTHVFYAPSDAVNEVREAEGEYCAVVYGRRSKYVVEYGVID